MLLTLLGVLLAGHLEAGSPSPVEFQDAATRSEGQWVTLFDGTSLAGWTTTGGRYDGAAEWAVEDGAITGRRGPNGAGGLIYTEAPYRNFELLCDVRVDYPFDSGIFVRMMPAGGRKGAQITIDHRPGGEIGGIYSDGWLQHNPKGEQLFRKGEWNRFYVRCTGDMRIVTYVNGEHLVSYELPEDAAKSGDYARTGLIGLQVHGAENAAASHSVGIRNVIVRDLGEAQSVPVTDGLFKYDKSGRAELTSRGSTVGWSSMFDGKTYDGWELVGDEAGFCVEDGVMAFDQGGGGHLRTLKDYRNFRLRLDFKTIRLANSGVFLRSARDDSNPSYSGCEIQILDDFNWESATNSTLRDYQFSGGLYGAVANPERGALRPLGSWNTYDILVDGSRIRVSLNGIELYDVDTFEVDVKPAFADRARTGFIGLQRHSPAQAGEGAYLWFRNLFVKEL